MDIVKLTTDIRIANKLISFAGESKSVIVLGPTRAGKSTLVCMLSEKYQLYKVDQGATLFITATTGRQDLEISRKAQSCTKLPAKQEAKRGGTLWDTPGFGDNKGVCQEILNAYYIKRLMDCHTSVKTMYVTSLVQMQGAAKDFIAGLATVLKMFESVENFHQHVTMVVTGVRPGTSLEHLKDMIRINIIDSTELENDGIDSVRKFLGFVVGGKVSLTMMPEPSFETRKSGGGPEISVLMKPEETAPFVDDMWATLDKAEAVPKPRGTNVIVSDEAKVTIEGTLGSLYTELATSFKALIKTVMHHESDVRLSAPLDDELSIVRILTELDKFDLFKWLKQFADKNNILSTLTSSPEWAKTYQFPQDVLDAVKPLSVEISNQIGILKFFQEILKEKNASATNDKLFELLGQEMTTLDDFYKDQRARTAEKASNHLKNMLVVATKRHLQIFLDKTISNSACFVSDVKCELLPIKGDIQKIVAKLKGTSLLSAACVGTKEHAQLQDNFASALRIYAGFKTTELQKQVTIGEAIEEMCNELLQSYVKGSTSCQEVANTGAEHPDKIRTVHFYTDASEVEILKQQCLDLASTVNETAQGRKHMELLSEVAELKDQVARLQESTKESVVVKGLQDDVTRLEAKEKQAEKENEKLQEKVVGLEARVEAKTQRKSFFHRIPRFRT